MYEKLKNGDDLYDHEVLEVLLYSACPRINTNPLAHALISRFGSLSEVFTASVDELKEVEGVGDSVAKYIKTVGLCAERAGAIGNSPTIKNFGDCKRFIHLRLKDRSEEYIELYFLNKAGRVERIFQYTSGEKSRAIADMDAIARSIALARPYAVIIAHNHLTGTKNPSDHDDTFTRMVQFMCNMNDAILYDHIIYYGENDIFSYSESGRLDKVKAICSWETFERWIKTLN